MATRTKRPRKTLTPAQQAAADARRQHIKNVSQQIAALTDDQRLDLARNVGTIVTCEERALSHYNHCMLALQRPDATVIGGFQQWHRLGRMVRKGEHGAYIWVPLGRRDTNDHGLTTTAMPDERRFMLVAVFDVSQTDVVPQNPEGDTV